MGRGLNDLQLFNFKNVFVFDTCQSGYQNNLGDLEDGFIA